MKITSIKSTSACWLKGIAPLALVLSFGSIQDGFAQTTVTPDIAASVRPPEEHPGDTSAIPATGTPLIWGPFTLHPQIFYRFSSIDGIQAQRGVSTKTDIHTIAPALSTEIGRHWTLRYAQTWNLYSNPDFRDTLEQAVSAYWNTQYDVWTLTAAHTSSFTDSIMVETAQQTKLNTHNSTFTALYAMGSRYALESVFTQNLLYSSGYQDPQTWTVREMLHRQTSPQVDTAVGTQYSYTAIKKTADMAALQLLASLTWRPIQHVSLSVQAGVENRRVYTDPSVDVRNPVYTVSLQLDPVTKTQIGVTASRSTSASFLDGQLTESVQYGLNFQQQLFKRMQFTTVYSRLETKYKTPQNPGLTARKDTTDLVNVGLNTTFFTRLRAGLTYQYTNNASNVAGFKFESNQYGVELGYSF